MLSLERLGAPALLLKAWIVFQEQRHDLGACWKYSVRPIADLLNQKLHFNKTFR